MNISESNIKAISLSKYLLKVRNIFEENLFIEWVEAEVASYNLARTGHCYLELVEIDSLNKEVAKTKATIWKSRYSFIEDKFGKITGSQLTTGIKIKIKVKANFSEIYSFSLTILDIDPIFTLGGIEAIVQVYFFLSFLIQGYSVILIIIA